MEILLTAIFQPTNPWTAALVGLAGAYLDTKIFGKTTTFEGQRLSDLSLQASTYGLPIPKVYGRFRVGGNIIWGTNYVEHRKEESSGGKGGGSKTKTITYTYSVSVAIGLHDGPINGISRVWADGKEVTEKFFGAEPSIANTIYYGTEEQEPDPFIQSIESEKFIPAYRGLAYIVLKDFNVTDFGNRIPNFTFEIVRAVDGLESVIKEVSNSAGLATTGIEHDVAMDSKDFWLDHVRGMMTTADETYRAKLEKLATLHDFFAVETNGTIEFRYKRGCETYPVLNDYFGAKDGNQAAEKMYDVTRQHDMELPRSVTVSYLSLDKEYQSGSMDAVRPTVKNQNIVKVGLEDIVLSDAEAKTLAEQKLYEAWVRRSTIKLILPIWWAFLAPGDIILCELAGRNRTVQITKTTYAPPGVISVEATDVGGNTYSRTERSADAEIQPSPRIEPSLVTLHLLDIPKLPADTSTTLNLYAAATGKPYYGAALYETRDGGASWTLKGLLDNATAAGATTTLLTDGVTDFWDEANAVVVQLIAGALESRPEIDVLNGYNAAVVGNEIIQFRMAELIGDRTYRLSGLLRGRLGTEDQVGSHAAGERFVLLEAATLVLVNAPITDWYAERMYRIGPVIESVASELYQTITFTNQARAYRPWSVCHIAGSRDANGRLTLTWCRRDRSGGEWLDGSDIAMSEQVEKYELDIMAGATVKRTLTAYTQIIQYTENMQLEDFGSLQSELTVRIYQMSALRGRGIMKEATV